MHRFGAVRVLGCAAANERRAAAADSLTAC